MLQRLLSYDDELYGDGLWSLEQLEEMDSRFVAAVERAFKLGLESRAAARASYVVKSSLNGSRRRAEEAAIEAGWVWFTRRNKSEEVSFAAVVAFVRARVPNIEPG